MAVIFVDNTLVTDCIGTYSVESRNNSGDETAYNTPQKAADISQPGDIIYIRAGTYYHPTTQSAVPVMKILTSGTVDKPITYKNYNGEEVIFDAYNPATSARKYNAIALGVQPSSSQDVSGTGVNYVIIDGLIVQGASYRGLGIFGPANKTADAVNPTTGVIIKNCIARNNIGFGIQSIGTLTNCLIENCEAYGNTITGISYNRMDKDWDAALPDNTMNAARYCILRNCLSYNNNNPAQPGNTDGISVSNAYRCIIENNIAFDNSDDGIDIYESVECTVRNNISFNHNTEGGNCAGLKFSAGGGGGHTIAGNVIFNNKGISLEGSNPTPWRIYRPSKVVNNTVYKGSHGLLLGSSYDTSFPGFPKPYLRNNLILDGDLTFYPNLIDSDYNFLSDTSSLQSLRAAGQDLHSVTGDAGLINKDVVIDTAFQAGWGIQQKLDFIRSQVKAAFSLVPSSICKAAGENGIDIGAYTGEQQMAITWNIIISNLTETKVGDVAAERVDPAGPTRSYSYTNIPLATQADQLAIINTIEQQVVVDELADFRVATEQYIKSELETWDASR